jgi:hypothetical protein
VKAEEFQEKEENESIDANIDDYLKPVILVWTL